MGIKVVIRFFNQNYTNFHSHYHYLLPSIKKVELTTLIEYYTVGEVIFNIGS